MDTWIPVSTSNPILSACICTLAYRYRKLGIHGYPGIPLVKSAK